MLSKHSHFHIHLCMLHTQVNNALSMLYTCTWLYVLTFRITQPLSTINRFDSHTYTIHFPLFAPYRHLIFHIQAFVSGSNACVCNALAISISAHSLFGLMNALRSCGWHRSTHYLSAAAAVVVDAFVAATSFHDVVVFPPRSGGACNIGSEWQFRLLLFLVISLTGAIVYDTRCVHRADNDSASFLGSIVIIFYMRVYHPLVYMSVGVLYCSAQVLAYFSHGSHLHAYTHTHTPGFPHVLDDLI